MTSPRPHRIRARKRGRAANAAGTDGASSDIAPLRLDDPALYINRELSLLAFQKRVLEEAQDESNPLLERFKFLSILGSNLDEFFMVRVAGLKRQLESGSAPPGPDRMTPAQQLAAIRSEVSNLLSVAHSCLSQQLLPALKEEGVQILKYSELNARQRARARDYFIHTVFPVLTPLAFDPGRPFPHISNLSVNLAVLIRDLDDNERFARIKVPDTLPQLVPLDRIHGASSRRLDALKSRNFVWLEDLIAANLADLFPGMEVLDAHPFHVTRNAELAIQELEAADLLETTEEGLRQRRFGDVVRLKVNYTMPVSILQILVNNLEIDLEDVYHVQGMLNLSRLRYLQVINRSDLKYPNFVPVIPSNLYPDNKEVDIFSAIRQKDFLLHHPYDSFQPVIDFLRAAARDPDVLAIKMTLYRAGANSPVVEALLDAMEYGKQVAVLVELKARFDEESNIEWARALEAEGVHVVYGLLGLKVHSKVAMVVRREGDTIKRYVHLGTGNYNPVTAHFYTDTGLFTCDEEIGADVTDLFNYLTGYSAKTDYRKLAVAPINLRQRIEALIKREIRHQQHGERGHLIFKMNALVDQEMIELLYEASRAGVQVDLLVRGICCMRPGIPGVSENVRVVSIVGRFLEHSRIYYFRNGGKEEILMGSADLMPRNLNGRVEVLFPLEEQRLIRTVRDDILTMYLSDRVKAREMKPDGSYVRMLPKPSEKRLNAQSEFIARRLSSNDTRPERTDEN
ncbi:MAG: polyphosphate kinase 1 [Candidatus Obscuribacterales bacterium]|jgi:polyphosphate kinase|nr:polyphosphate kinase 1 [Candidatus Obscuribacterales bacterium]